MAQEIPALEALELHKDRIYCTPQSRVFVQVYRDEEGWMMLIPGRGTRIYADEPPELLLRVLPGYHADGYYKLVNSPSPRSILKKVASFFRKGFPDVPYSDWQVRYTPPRSEWPEVKRPA